MTAACGDDNPTAVGMGDVVEAKKLPRTPTNQRASDLVEHGFDLDVARRESPRDVQESIADSFGLEMRGGPRNEFGQRGDGLWPTGAHENTLWGGDSSPGYHTPKRGADWCLGHAAGPVAWPGVLCQQRRLRTLSRISSSLGCV